MKNLKFVNGEVTNPKSIGPQIVVHVCNAVGIWHGSNAEKIYSRWPESRRAFLAWYRCRQHNDFGMGAVQFVNENRTHVNRIIRVANLVARSTPESAVRYRDYRKGLIAVRRKARQLGATVHLPEIENPLDSWRDLQQIVEDVLSVANIPVFVYCDAKRYSGHSNPSMFSRVVRPVRPRFELVDFRMN